MDDATTILCSKVARAAIARTISDRLQLPFADNHKAQSSDIVGKPHLALVNYELLGYPMVDSLVPLALMSGQTEQDEEGDIEVGITSTDQLIAATNADLHNRLLNLSPKFGLDVSVDFQNPTLNKVYEDILRTAEFAGRVEGDSIELKAARDLLFPVDETGISRKSSLYILYEEYENRVLKLTQKRDKANLEGRVDTVNVLRNQLARVNAEWVSLGQKATVKKALETITKADADAGFEDERNRFIETLEASKKVPIDGGEYASVRIHPLSKLIDPESRWLEVSLNKDNILSALDKKTSETFGLSSDQIESALPFIKSVIFEYSEVLLGREWLQNEFLEAGYWRHSDDILSDGKGTGLAPTVASRAIFIKKAALTLNADLKVSEGLIAPSALKYLMYNPIKTPLLMNLQKSEVKAKLNTNLNQIHARRVATLVKTNKVEVEKRKRITRPVVRSTVRPSAAINRPTAFTAPAIASFGAAVIHPITRPSTAIPRPADLPASTIAAFATTLRLPPMMLHPNAKLKVNGRIKMAGGALPRDLVLITNMTANNSTSRDEIIRLKKNGLGQFEFTYVWKNFVASKPSHLFNFKLKDNSGSVLAEKNITLDEFNKVATITWTMSTVTDELKLCRSANPTLMGYGLEILPKCPNPKDNFIWE